MAFKLMDLINDAKLEYPQFSQSSKADYSDYQDWNPDDYKSDVLLPGRIVQRVDGMTTLDLTLRESNTYNPYVIMLVPDNIAQ